MNGGVLHVTTKLVLGRWSIGHFEQAGGMVVLDGAANGVYDMPGSSYTIRGGALVATNGTFYCGDVENANSYRKYVNLEGGSVRLGTLAVGSRNAQGTLTVSGGTNDVKTLVLGGWSSSRPILTPCGSADAGARLAISGSARFGESFYKMLVKFQADINEHGVIPLTIGGDVTINPNTTFLATSTNAAPGVYTVMSWSGKLYGAANLLYSAETDPERIEYDLDTAGKALKVIVSDPDRVTLITIR